jgi:asparagine synthase (glutamine-hydrolysing)
MRIFVCLLALDGQLITDEVRRRFESLPRDRRLAFRWHDWPGGSVLTTSFHADWCLVATEGESFAAGVARVDNRAELARWAGLEDQGTDLDFVLRLVRERGASCIPRILGDFGFVAWNADTRTAVAASDAMAVRKVYYLELGEMLVFSSHAEALASGRQYERRFLAEQVASAASSPELTVYEGVKAVPAGTMMEFDGARFGAVRYWCPEDSTPSRPLVISEEEAANTLRVLLIEAVKARVPRTEQAWGQLSGGLDSSSVVSVVQWLAEGGEIPCGLTGTVTYVDRESTPSDERSYSSAVVSRWGLPNEQILNPPMWYDARYGPPRIDQPRPNLMFYPREARLVEIVAGSGARVLLTGQGPDEYMRGSMFFFADWIVRGRLGPTLKEMLRRAAIGRVSFWELAYRNALAPLLPRSWHRWVGPGTAQLPRWIPRKVAREYGLDQHRFELALHGGPLGGKYRHTMVTSAVGLSRSMGHLLLDDGLDVRHPFLDRRLLEFGLALPPELTTRPYAGKWVLREAMRGMVPELIRTRVGKGSQNERHAWALAHQRELLAPLVRTPLLADLGVVDGAELRKSFDEAPRQGQSRGDPHAALQQCLAVEAWLQVRAGLWPAGQSSNGHLHAGSSLHTPRTGRYMGGRYEEDLSRSCRAGERQCRA